MLVNIRSTAIKNNIKATKKIHYLKKLIKLKMQLLINFPSTFKNKVKNTHFKGFDKNLRNLEEYNLLDAEEVLYLIENKYETFRYATLNFLHFETINN